MGNHVSYAYYALYIMKIYKLTNSMSYQKSFWKKSPRTKKVGLKPVVPNRSVFPWSTRRACHQWSFRKVPFFLVGSVAFFSTQLARTIRGIYCQIGGFISPIPPIKGTRNRLLMSAMMCPRVGNCLTLDIFRRIPPEVFPVFDWYVFGVRSYRTSISALDV